MPEFDWLARQILQPLACKLLLLPIDRDHGIAKPELQPSLNRFLSKYEAEISDPEK